MSSTKSDASARSSKKRVVSEIKPVRLTSDGSIPMNKRVKDGTCDDDGAISVGGTTVRYQSQKGIKQMLSLASATVSSNYIYITTYTYIYIIVYTAEKNHIHKRYFKNQTLKY